MIKTIVKRDGRTEEFSPSKINGWGEWAARNLGRYVDWSQVVMDAVAGMPEKTKSRDLQERLIKACLDMDGWSYNKMAGRLYASFLVKEIFGGNIPTVKQVHDKMRKAGLMIKLNYSDDEYEQIEKMIKHERDFDSTHFELNQVRRKYSLQDRKKGKEFETQQFVYMRVAMFLAETEESDRLVHVKKYYDLMSTKVMNIPTPVFVNAATTKKGYASCCVWTCEDTADSIEAGSHITYVMTCQSAGIGGHMQVRSINDGVRGGQILHQGKLPYYRYIMNASKANLQAGRGGAVTMHNNAFDPEITDLSNLKNPKTIEEKRIRDMDYSFSFNKEFARKAARKEDVILFNAHTAPDLYQAMYSGDETEFKRLYTEYESKPEFAKSKKPALDILVQALNQGVETGRNYETNVTELNTHTPFKDKIYSSNLCQEIALPTSPYPHLSYLYSSEDHGKGEIGLCSIAAIVYSNVKDDEHLEEAMFYTLRMIDRCIHASEYVFPHLGVTAKSRMSAGIGIIGLAHYMAKRKLSYSSQEGKDEMHRLAERHMFFAIKASLRLSREFGLAPWMHKTKWPDGWLPIDTYNKSVDGIVTAELQYDWEALRAEIIENGGLRNSVLIAHMPSESSSQAAGTTNSLYAIRHLSLIKGDNTNRNYWAAPDSEKLAKYYEIAYDIHWKDMTDCYAIFQKFTDQAISADFYEKILNDDRISSSEMVQKFLYRVKMGLKSKYYTNTQTTEGVDMDAEEVCEDCTL